MDLSSSPPMDIGAPVQFVKGVGPRPRWGGSAARDTRGFHTARIFPVYEKLGRLPGKPLRGILPGRGGEIPPTLADPLPADVRERLGVMGRGEALRRIHDPADED